MTTPRATGYREAAAIALFAASLGPTAASAAEIVLRNAWMRPAPTGAAQARAYVDIDSDVALKLTGASTPAARKVVLVQVRTRETTIDESVVRSLPIKAGTTTRLAFNGDHLRLTGITHDIGNGTPVPLTLTFRDATGKTLHASTDVLVRGLLRPGQVPADGKGVRMPAPEPATAPQTPQTPPKM
jgi:periplasmic copper chaperone A